RGHGRRDRGGAPSLLAGRLAPRPGRERDARVVLREAIRRRHGDEGHDRRRAGLRRLRLHEGVPSREADARREAVPDLRGHLADPTARDRPRAAHAEVTVAIDFSGRVALVTGGSRGLGRADALTLARAGADVAIADIQLESSDEDVSEWGALAAAAKQLGLVYTEQTVEEVRGLGRRGLALRCDVTSREQVDAAVARAFAEPGPG